MSSYILTQYFINIRILDLLSTFVALLSAFFISRSIIYMKILKIRTLCGEKILTRINVVMSSIFPDNELGLIIINQKSEVKTGWFLAVLYVFIRIMNELILTDVYLSIASTVSALIIIVSLYFICIFYIKIHNISVLFGLIEEEFRYEAQMNFPEAHFPNEVGKIRKQLLIFSEEKKGKYFPNNKEYTKKRIEKFITKLNYIWSNPDAVRRRKGITQKNRENS